MQPRNNPRLMTTSAQNTITCRNLWQVFGEKAEQRLADALSRSNDPNDVSQSLLSHNLIPAVRNVSFDVKQGELFVIMGLSGSGKSTLIRCLSRLVEVTSGQISIEGEDILAASKKRMTELRRSTLGMVFQHFGLFPHMSVIDNVAFPLKVSGLSKRERHKHVLPIIHMVGLEGREHAFPRELSGGQRQRVGIARSLAGDCSVWFLDEPFSALDPLIRRQLQDEFLEVRRKFNKTIIFITHDITEALKLADRIAIMRDGEIVQIGTPAEIVLSPVNAYVREFSKDVATGRHATVASVMQKGVQGDLESAPRVQSSMSIDAALAMSSAHLAPLAVEDDTGQLIGTVSPKDLADAALRDAS